MKCIKGGTVIHTVPPFYDFHLLALTKNGNNYLSKKVKSFKQLLKTMEKTTIFNNK